MLLKFANKKIKEFANGAFVCVNDGKPFEVSENMGNELLKAETVLFGGEKVKIFEEEKPKVGKAKEEKGDK